MENHCLQKTEEESLSDNTQLSTLKETNVDDNTRNDIKENMQGNSTSKERLCNPYPFDQYHCLHTYSKYSCFNIPESGTLNYIEPCHEFKCFNNTTEQTKMFKFSKEVIRFAAACMNRRTNGTIHFGIADKPHGQVLGVVVEDKEAFGNERMLAINNCFSDNHKQAALDCIKPPRFVEVLHNDETSLNTYVIEVDIVPASVICKDHLFLTQEVVEKGQKIKGPKQFLVREGSSSKNLIPKNSTKSDTEKLLNDFAPMVLKWSQLRQQNEEKHLSEIKCSTQGSRLSHMITGGSCSLDKSHFERYVIVTNKSHSSQFESLGFLLELNPISVLDFDPESAKQGLQRHFESQITVNPHLPGQYKITEGVAETAYKLKLTRNTSWVFCNGGIEKEAPSDLNQWLMDKGASVRDVISFLCRKDVLPNKRFLVIFLLLSTVSEKMDPLVETFSAFWQELRGTNQILCICDSKNAFTSWKNLIEARCGIDVSGRCIYELSLAEVNGTVLSLLSENRRAKRFLPCGGESKVVLNKKVEFSLTTLDVLCVNQCEGGNEDKVAIEENFYRGGKVSWWNFYFLEKGESSQVVRQKNINLISNTILDTRFHTKACVLINLVHAPGCGGTTLGMHILWILREKFRCAVLKDKNSNFSEVADQVVKLLLYKHEDQLPRVPVLLMIDDFDDTKKVLHLQRLIENKCDKNIKSTQVVLLNCFRSETPEHTDINEHTFFISNVFSDEDHKLFEKKLSETEKAYKHANNLYIFMLMKKKLKSEYFQGVVHNTLRSFSIDQLQSKLLAVLTLLTVNSKHTSLSFFLCKKFLGLNSKPIFGTESPKELFGKFSNLICPVTDKNDEQYGHVKMIHPQIAIYCYQELTTTHKMTKADITDLLPQVIELCDNTEDKCKLLQKPNILNIQWKNVSEFFSDLKMSWKFHSTRAVTTRPLG